ncbi:MAG: hypothetical protein WAM91_04550 [Candidatus Acidiferrales bacterium]
MVCPTCAKEIPPNTLMCPSCGVLIVGAAPHASPAQFAGGIPPQQPDGESPSGWTVFLWISCLILSILIVFLNFASTRRAYPEFTSEALGYFVGRCLFAFGLGLIGLLIYSKAKRGKKNPAMKAFVTVSVAFVLTLIAFVGSMASASTTQDTGVNARVGELLKESAGQAPKSPNQGQWEEPVRSFFHDLLEFNKQYAAEAAQLSDPTLAPMYSATSYASKAQIQGRVDLLNKTSEVEEKYSSIDPLITKMKERIQAASMPQRSKDALINGFVKGVQGSLAPRVKVFDSEKRWLVASIDLYQFALREKDNVSIQNGKLVFRNGDSKEFIDRQSQAIKLRDDFLQSKKEFDADAADILSQLGLNKSDITGKSGSGTTGH